MKFIDIGSKYLSVIKIKHNTFCVLGPGFHYKYGPIDSDDDEIILHTLKHALAWQLKIRGFPHDLCNCREVSDEKP